ncbi:MRL1 [Candida pseudojiufengensis]|uniref:MRL1 n=1 Tax=Candida pseudojiufengensis TaxID=497109 RepID=UPI0022246D6C|nr:MRL1 [Candida pseudojiufengensis]KAI5966520.1 MRL1 [Candida pseudojiufengensis]
MSKSIRRAIIPLITLLIILGITILQRSRPDDSLYQTSSEIFDSISHFTFTSPATNNSPQSKQNIQNNLDKSISNSKDSTDEQEEQPLDPCTVFNPISKGFIDLRGLSSFGNENKPLPWNSKGYDSGKNYTIGICSTPFKKLHDNDIKDNLNSSLVGGYYMENNKYISIGQFSTQPKFRGKKLTITYENGSYCNNLFDQRGNPLQKSTILTFTCDREMSAKATISYIGNFNDCNYFFEVKSHHACPTAAKANNTAAVWIFLFILLAALFVYFSGGILYRQMRKNNTSKV